MELFCRTLPLQQAATCMLVLETESHLLVIVDSLPAELSKIPLLATHLSLFTVLQDVLQSGFSIIS